MLLSKTVFIIRRLVSNHFAFKLYSRKFLSSLSGVMCAEKNLSMDELSFSMMCRQLAPPLTNERHKGQSGRIGVFGGCLEYTGAPYFAAISALKVGADLAHVFCMKEAAPVIKSYSPELIVHPYLDDHNAIKKIEPWLDRLHVILIGPGLGRDNETFTTIGKVIELCRNKHKGLVIDADGLFYLSQNLEIIKNYPKPGVILTPNVVEFARLMGAEDDNPETSIMTSFFDLGSHITIVKKGREDEIMDYAKKVSVSGGGSGRRCGGQGDLLSGSLATFFAWALQHKIDADVGHDDRSMIACYAACKLTRECNARAFSKMGRSMTCTDMIREIGEVFSDQFEQK